VGTQGVFSKARGGYEALSTSSAISRRLRVSRGICLPSDCPMHFICGSRDVIHSWAIPGLGIKIDCVPGYNSHRRVLLRWRGIYWGQCMEVCGRYHHWMPILVHVTHKDIFLSWCVAYLGLLVHAKPSPSALGEDWLKAGGLDAVRGALGR
jgi:heme/copper-type cytochrome/quinol oxidase subunit 2